MRDPLVHFLLAAQIELINANFAHTSSRPRTTTELENLIERVSAFRS